MKPVAFVGTARDDLSAFPEDARRDAGFDLWQVQMGDEPTDWRPMTTVGPGAVEIRVHSGGAFRVIYVAKFRDTLYVLHCFQKKSQKTDIRDIELARKRYKEIAS